MLVFLLEIINVCLVALSKISVKNLVAIPQDIRSIIDVNLGDKILWILKDEEIIVRKV